MAVARNNVYRSAKPPSTKSHVGMDTERKKGKLGANAMKRVAAGAPLPTPWLFEPAKHTYDRADYCLDCIFLR